MYIISIFPTPPFCSRVMNATFTVPVIRIADFINNVVATRSLPADQPGAVVMKLDVEVPPLSYVLHIVIVNIDLH